MAALRRQSGRSVSSSLPRPILVLRATDGSPLHCSLAIVLPIGGARPATPRIRSVTKSRPGGAARSPPKEPQKVDEFAEAAACHQRPGRQPECVWARPPCGEPACGATISIPRSAISISTTASAARRPYPGDASAACILHGRQDRSEGGRQPEGAVHACWINPAHRRRPLPPPAARRRARPDTTEQSAAGSERPDG